jgi:Protein of unknown function (DUF3435)
LVLGLYSGPALKPSLWAGAKSQSSKTANDLGPLPTLKLQFVSLLSVARLHSSKAAIDLAPLGLHRRESLPHEHAGEPLKQQLGGAATSHPSYKKLNSEINGERRRQRDALLKKVREECDVENPLREIEQLFSGLSLART